jgi:phage tail sheath protein FI
LLDRERGAHHTPAVEPMIGVVDLEIDVGRDDHAVLNEQGVNVLRCVPGRGFAIWGGRTLERDRQHRHVAHRRLIHRLVRAIRNVAEPLVFETNGPELWLQLVRGITSVLLEAWRSGALKGQRAEEAFRVQCDAETNPPEEIDLGRCLCRVSVAPAVPMEFITLRLALGRDGALEVLP